MIQEKENALAELQNERNSIIEFITEQKLKLTEASLLVKTHGRYMDQTDYQQLKDGVRHSTEELHDINRRIKSIKKLLNNPTAQSKYFQKAAEILLEEDIIKEIEDLAFEMASN